MYICMSSKLHSFLSGQHNVEISLLLWYWMALELNLGAAIFQFMGHILLQLLTQKYVNMFPFVVHKVEGRLRRFLTSSEGLCDCAERILCSVGPNH